MIQRNLKSYIHCDPAGNSVASAVFPLHPKHTNDNNITIYINICIHKETHKKTCHAHTHSHTPTAPQAKVTTYDKIHETYYTMKECSWGIQYI